MHTGEPDNSTTAMVLYSDNSEAVEWVNMCWRKVILLPHGQKAMYCSLCHPKSCSCAALFASYEGLALCADEGVAAFRCGACTRGAWSAG